MAKHIAICVNTENGREGFVISAATWESAEQMAERCDNRVGYFGFDSFSEALAEASDMANGSPLAIARSRKRSAAD